MASKRPTEKQKEKLCNSKMFRSNSADLTVNKNFQDDVSYDDDGTLRFDGRTKVGKEINRIMKSRNRTSADQIDDEDEIYEPYDDWEPEYTKEEEYEEDDDDDIDDTVPWEFRNPENYWNYVHGRNHDEDDDGVADLYED